MSFIDQIGRSSRSKLVPVQGKVKFFDNDRGFGFISRDAGEDVFVHVSNLQAGAALSEGQTVEFEVGPGRKSEEAKNVRAV
jgi:cold shock protein